MSALPHYDADTVYNAEQRPQLREAYLPHGKKNVVLSMYILFSERELTFTLAVVARPSVCLAV